MNWFEANEVFLSSYDLCSRLSYHEYAKLKLYADKHLSSVTINDDEGIIFEDRNSGVFFTLECVNNIWYVCILRDDQISAEFINGVVSNGKE